MVQEVEDLEAELKAHPLRNPSGLIDVEIPLNEMRTAEGVAATSANGSSSRNGKYIGHIRDGRRVGIAELVDWLYSTAIRPLVGEVLPGVIRAAREQRRPRPPGGKGGHAADLPALSEAANCSPFR